MARIDLGELYRRGLATAPDAVAPEDLVRLARGEPLGERHAAVLAALAGSEAAALAYRVAREIEPEARALADARYDAAERVRALPARPARRFAFLTPEAMAAGLVAVALAAALAFRGAGPAPGDAIAGGSTSDAIFDVSYETDFALASSMESGEAAADQIFADGESGG